MPKIAEGKIQCNQHCGTKAYVTGSIVARPVVEKRRETSGKAQRQRKKTSRPMKLIALLCCLAHSDRAWTPSPARSHWMTAKEHRREVPAGRLIITRIQSEPIWLLETSKVMSLRKRVELTRAVIPAPVIRFAPTQSLVRRGK